MLKIKIYTEGVSSFGELYSADEHIPTEDERLADLAKEIEELRKNAEHPSIGWRRVLARQKASKFFRLFL